MTLNLKYISDSEGRPEAVLISVADWQKIQEKLDEAEFVTKLGADLRGAFAEVSEHMNGKRKLKDARSVIAKL